jgi:uncharacterized protein YdeI (YjbR/CyaY-like superfamily)
MSWQVNHGYWQNSISLTEKLGVHGLKNIIIKKWLIYPKKTSGKPRILYNDAVEEALYFGWIDSTTKRIDENSYAQRFSPRNPKTPYSESNKQRLMKLVKEGKGYTVSSSNNQRYS